MKSHYPLKVEPMEDYRLLIVFDNEEQRMFNVKPYLSDPYFAPIADPAVFRTVRTTCLSVEWEGEIDICPDELYYNSLPVK